MQKDEKWHPVADYEGLYEVSNFGNVKSIRRQGSDGRLLKQRLNNKGYCVVSLCKNGQYTTSFIHRLVAMAFVPNPMRLPFVNHKDENKHNNISDNLEWCTCQYNNNYGTARERATATRYKPCMGEWPDGTTQVFNSCTLAGKVTGISQGNIWGVCNGLWKTAGGVRWRYV